MYKIYINATPIILVDQVDLVKLPAPNDKRIIARYPGKPKFLLHYIDMLEKSDRYEAIYLFSKNFDKLSTDFNGLFKIIDAAGGIVHNNLKEILFIYRKGFWDLPKGKIDKGETREEAAVREVQEETGVENLKLQDFIKATYHTYRSKKEKRILKRTFWFNMRTNDHSLIPQIEEDIEQAIWMTREEFLKDCQPVYGNILSLIEELTS